METSLDTVIVIGHLNNRAEIIKSSFITCLADLFNCIRLTRDATIQVIVCRKLSLLIHADLDDKYPVGNMFKVLIRTV